MQAQSGLGELRLLDFLTSALYGGRPRLIPTLFLILGLGYQPERVQAGIYLMFYTLLPSLLLLVGILFVYSSLGSLCLCLLCGNDSSVGGLFYVCIKLSGSLRMYGSFRDNTVSIIIVIANPRMSFTVK
jgi:hypothetical protein